MAPSRLYEIALLAPLAEQLVDAAGIEPGMRVVEVGARRGVLTARLAAAVGAAGGVSAVEASETAAQTLRDELQAARVTARVLAAPFAALPFARGEFDVALSLFGVSVARGGGPALGELERVAHRAAVVMRAERPPVPEELLERAWQEAAGFVPPPARAPAPLRAPAGWSVTPLRDVVRFDSARQLWDALTTGPPGRAPAFVVDAVFERYRELLAAHEAADGTLRIPVTVAILRSGGDARPR